MADPFDSFYRVMTGEDEDTEFTGFHTRLFDDEDTEFTGFHTRLFDD
jgi:hypothetical protein